MEVFMSVPRCFKIFTATTVAQPLIATTLTAAIRGSGLTAQNALVVDSSMFVNSDTVNLASVSAGVIMSTEKAVQVQVVDGTTIKGIFAKDHAAGEFVILSWPCQNIMVQVDKSNVPAGSLFLGSNPQKVPTVAGANAFHDLALTLFYSGPQGFADADNTQNYWIISSTATAGYLPSAVQS